MDYRGMFDRKHVGAWDLEGKEVTVEISHVKAEVLENKQGKTKKPVVYFVGTDKGMTINKTNGATIAAMYGPDTAKWAGKLITIYPTQVAFGPSMVDAIRVKPGVPKGKPSAVRNDVPVDEAMRAKQDAAVGRDAANTGPAR